VRQPSCWLHRVVRDEKVIDKLTSLLRHPWTKNPATAARRVSREALSRSVRSTTQWLLRRVRSTVEV
jgi:hypothetical protein